MNFADRMKAQQTEVTITKRKYSKACVDAMQRILEDEQCEIMFDVMPGGCGWKHSSCMR